MTAPISTLDSDLYRLAQSVWTREDAKLFILTHQVGRRNLTKEQRIEMVARIVLLRQEQTEKTQRANLKQGDKTPDVTEIVPSGKRTVAAAAEEFDVPREPLQKAVNIVKGKPIKPVETQECPQCGEQVVRRTPSIKKHNRDKHSVDSPFLLRPACTATNKDGSPCPGDAEDNGLCIVHAEGSTPLTITQSEKPSRAQIEKSLLEEMKAAVDVLIAHSIRQTNHLSTRDRRQVFKVLVYAMKEYAKLVFKFSKKLKASAPGTSAEIAA